MAVAQDLLEILRCPYCVSGETRQPGDDPGQLELVRDGTWLVCQEPDCGRKYPIKEDIPVMLIEEGERFQATPREELPDIPPAEERAVLSAPPPPPALDERQQMALILLGLAVGIGVFVLLVILLRRKCASCGEGNG